MCSFTFVFRCFLLKDEFYFRTHCIILIAYLPLGEGYHFNCLPPLGGGYYSICLPPLGGRGGNIQITYPPRPVNKNAFCSWRSGKKMLQGKHLPRMQGNMRSLRRILSWGLRRPGQKYTPKILPALRAGK